MVLLAAYAQYEIELDNAYYCIFIHSHSAVKGIFLTSLTPAGCEHHCCGMVANGKKLFANV